MSAELLEAINKGSLKDVQRLLQKGGVDPAYDNNAALRAAARKGWIEVVNQLLQVEAVRTGAAANGNEAFREAARNDHRQVVERLLQIPAVRKNAAANDNEALQQMVSHSTARGLACKDYLHEVDDLLRIDDVRNAAHANDNAALRSAVKNGHLAIVQRLLHIAKVREYAAHNQDTLLELVGKECKKKDFPVARLPEYLRVEKQLLKIAAASDADTKEKQDAKSLMFSDTAPAKLVKPGSLLEASEPKESPENPRSPKTH